MYQNLLKWKEKKEETNKDANITKETKIITINATWDKVLGGLPAYDAILFDPYPLNEKEFHDYWLNDGNFAAHFFPLAAKHLRKNGVFTYFSNEIDSLARRHQRQLLKHFSSIEIKIIRNLGPPEDCQYWWADSMAVVRAIK